LVRILRGYIITDSSALVENETIIVLIQVPNTY
jgi:hypothetical protein